MRRESIALHRAAAWCVAVLAFVLLVVGSRTALRALVPAPDPDPTPSARAETTLREVDDARRLATPEAAEAAAEAGPTRLASRSVRRVARAPGDEPMEQHPACVIEGVVRSVSGLLQQPVELQVDHPTGGTARTRLYFDRATPDSRGRMAPFKLVKPAQGAYVLRAVVLGDFDYTVEPREYRIEQSTSGVEFVVRDDVAHVDLDVLALGTDGAELPAAQLHWRVPRNAEYSIDELIHGGLRSEALEPDGGPELRHVPVTNPLECLVTAQGYRPHRAVTHLFASDRRLEVRMEPGWGIYLVDMGVRTIRPAQSPPLLGEIHVDGRRIGLTDPSGVTYVEADLLPTEFAVLYGGRRAKLLRSVPKDRLVVTIDHNLLEPEGYVPRPARD